MTIQTLFRMIEPGTTDVQRARLWSDSTGIARALRTRWSDLDPHTISDIAGERDKLIVALRNLYGVCDAEAERRVRAWENTLLALR